MTTKLFLSNRTVIQLARKAVGQITELDEIYEGKDDGEYRVKIYPVPRGGIPATYALMTNLAIEIVKDPITGEQLVTLGDFLKDKDNDSAEQ